MLIGLTCGGIFAWIVFIVARNIARGMQQRQQPDAEIAAFVLVAILMGLFVTPIVVLLVWSVLNAGRPWP